MSRSQRISTRRQSSRTKSPLMGKQNTDTIYLMQNQNEVLRLKNLETDQKIINMRRELTQQNQKLILYQREIEDLRILIRDAGRTQDLSLQRQKKMVQDKIALVRGNIDVFTRKIAEAREAAIFQQAKLPNVHDDKINFQKDLWKAKVQKEGTKVTLDNLQKQVQRLRSQNQSLVAKRKHFQPKQRQISQQIEQRIRFVKNIKASQSNVRKSEVSKVMNFMVHQMQKNRLKQAFMAIERKSLIRKLMQKKIFMLSLIRKKFVNGLKVRGLQAFRGNFRPMVQIEKTVRIIQQTQKRRIKNKIFRIWRSQSAKAEFSLIRRFQVNNQLQKLQKTFMKMNLYSAFNIIKRYKNSIYHAQACKTIHLIWRTGEKRAQTYFFSSLKLLINQLQINDELDSHAKFQSQMLVKSVYFSALAKITRDNQVVNRTIKFRYFRLLKKLIAIRRKRVLGQMLTMTNQKLKDIDTQSKCFAAFSYQTVLGLHDNAQRQNLELKQRNQKTRQEFNNFESQKAVQYKQLSILKIGCYLKKVMQKSFDTWREVNKKVTKLSITLSILHFKMFHWANHGFYMIQRQSYENKKQQINQQLEKLEELHNLEKQQNFKFKQIFLEKTKQIKRLKLKTIMRKKIVEEKELLRFYFFKFFKSGFKAWKFRKIFQRVDTLISQKLNKVFLFCLKQNKKEISENQRIQRYLQYQQEKFRINLMQSALSAFSFNRNRNARIKRLLDGIFYRNTQLDIYNFYQKIKAMYAAHKEEQNALEIKMKLLQKQDADDSINRTELSIEQLSDRLRYKEKAFFNRKVLALKIFYVRNIRQNVGHYIHRWKDKIDHEKRISEFAQIVERKTRIIIKQRFFINLQKESYEKQLEELKQKADRFKSQIQGGGDSFQNFVVSMQKKSQQMKKQNEQHKEETQKLERVTDRMDDIKIASFHRYWGKKMTFFIMRNWRRRIKQFKINWQRVFDILGYNLQRQAFDTISQQIKQEKMRDRIRINLQRVYMKNYRHNTGSFFRIWRLVNWNKKVEECKIEYEQQLGSTKIVYDTYQKRENWYNKDVNFRLNDRKLRKIMDFLKKYTRRKLQNNTRKKELEKWLKKGYQQQFYRIFSVIAGKKVEQKNIALKFQWSQQQKTIRTIFQRWANICHKKSTIRKILINKLIPHLIFNLSTQFFSRVKNYHRYMVVSKKDHRTFCIQRVIQTFQKKRKDILCTYLRIWKKHQYQMDMGRVLMKRLTRKSMYNRYEGCFYAWKRQKEAKDVLLYHAGEGQIKKRRFEIARLRRFIDDFKKEKGLLLQNEQGDFVVSPRFQDQKDKQAKKDNNLRYKFISRLILSMNGYNPAIKAWNNFKLYQKLRQNIRKKSLFVLNSIRKPEIYRAFKIWNKAAKDFRYMFDTMDRKGLIRILGRQKDKMEVQYGRKVNIQREVRDQMMRYKILSHQADRKQKLCALVLMRNARNKKRDAFLTWKDRVEQLKDTQALTLQQKGEIKIEEIEQQLRDFQDEEKYLQQQNRRLQQAVRQALQIAQMVKKITQDRDSLSKQIIMKQINCESLLEQNQKLNAKLYQAQKEAMNLLILSSAQP